MAMRALTTPDGAALDRSEQLKEALERVRVRENPAPPLPECRWQASCGGDLGWIAVSAESPGAAREKFAVAWRLRWLGVNAPTQAKATINPEAGAVMHGPHRLALWRRVPGIDSDWRVCFLMCNPSTADANADDATLRRCLGFAQAWRCGWLTVGNLWPYRATDPQALKRWLDTTHIAERNKWAAMNAIYVRRMVERADLVIAAWGNAGAWHEGDARMRQLLTDASAMPHVLDVTSKGFPKHPLYCAADAVPLPWSVTP
jgi:hypothetical protein